MVSRRALRCRRRARRKRERPVEDRSCMEGGGGDEGRFIGGPRGCRSNSGRWRYLGAAGKSAARRAGKTSLVVDRRIRAETALRLYDAQNVLAHKCRKSKDHPAGFPSPRLRFCARKRLPK